MAFERAKPLTRAGLEKLLSQTKNGRVGLIGDLCLDMYWVADMKISQLSRETPHYPLPVVEERYAPGGAGNVACNIAALEPNQIQVIGAVGDDWRGDLLLKSLREHGVSTDLVIQDSSIMTNTYIKPLRTGISDVVYEDPRLDFENRCPINEDIEKKVLANLDKMASCIDVLCVSDQMEFGCVTPAVREKICQLGKEGLTVLVDSRDRIGLYDHVIVKPNEVESSRLLGRTVYALDEAADAAQEIGNRTGTSAIVTLGAQGSMIFHKGSATHCPACSVKPPVDFCGAGDTFLSGLGVMLASGADLVQAAQVATLCSGVTVKKIGTTGTATHQELLDAIATYFPE